MVNVMLTGNNHSRSKQLNKTLIVRTLLREGPLSRKMIAEMTHLTPATITNLTAELIHDKIIYELGDMQSTRSGRRSVALDINAESGVSLGIHIRADRIEIGIVNLKGRVVKEYSFPYEQVPSQRELVPLLAQYIQQVTSEEELPLVGIGIGSLGLVDYENGIILSAKMGWKNLKLAPELSQAVTVPVYLDNNVNAMALAEKMFGNAKHNENFIFIYLSRGIGSGLVSNGKVYRRGRIGSGAFGHMTYYPDGEPCWCGNHGCLELYASGHMLLEQFQLRRLRELAELARRGNVEALQAIASAGEKIGTCLASFNNILYIEKVIVSGPLAEEDLPLIRSMNETVNRRSFVAADVEPVNIFASSLKSQAGVIGAASLALNEYFSTI